MATNAKLPRNSFADLGEAQVFHRCIRHLAGGRATDYRKMSGTGVSLERRAAIAAYAEKLAAAIKDDKSP